MSSKLLSKLLCKNIKANSTQTWGRSTTTTAKRKKKRESRLFCSPTRQFTDTDFGDSSPTHLKTIHRHFFKTVHRQNLILFYIHADEIIT